MSTRILAPLDASDTTQKPVNRATVIGNVVSLTLGSITSQTLMAVAVLLTARQLGAAEFGVYSAGFASAGLTSILFNLGLDTWLLRSAARDAASVKPLLSNAVAVKLLVGLPWLIGIVVLLPWLNPETFRAQLVLFSALAVWMEGLLMLGLAVFKASLQNRVTASLLIGARGGVLLFTVLLMAAHSRQALHYAEARLLVSVVILLVTLLLLPTRPGKSTWTALKQTAQVSLPFALSDLFTSIYVQADTTIAAIALTKEAVGFYAPSESLINALFAIPNAGYSVMVPVLVRLVETGRRSLNRVMTLTIAGFAAMGLVLWVGTWYISSALPIWILGNSFRESGPLLTILSPIIFLKSCSFAAAAILVAVGWQQRRMYVQAVSAIANVALNLAVIYRFGITGVAVVYVISEVLLTVGYMGWVVLWARQSGDRPEQRSK